MKPTPSIGLALSWLLAGCDPPECGAENIEITGGTRQERNAVRRGVHEFEAWTDEPVCLRAIALKPDLGGFMGRASSITSVVQLQEDLGDRLDVTLRHELCHLLDFRYRLSRAKPFDAGSEAPGSSYIFGSKHKTGDRREQFAEWCELGPAPPMVPILEAACGNGTPHWLAERVWRGVESTPFTLVGSPTTRIIDSVSSPHPLHATDAFTIDEWAVGGDRSSTTIWVDDEPTAMEHGAHGYTISSNPEDFDILYHDYLQDRVMWISEERSVPLAVEGGPWMGGTHENKAYLWEYQGGPLFVADLETGLVSTTGTIMEHRTRWFRWVDGSPATYLVEGRTTKLTKLLEPSVSLNLPSILTPIQWSGDWLIADYNYASQYEHWQVLPAFLNHPHPVRVAFHTETFELVASPPCPTTSAMGGQTIETTRPIAVGEGYGPWRIDLMESSLQVTVE